MDPGHRTPTTNASVLNSCWPKKKIIMKKKPKCLDIPAFVGCLCSGRFVYLTLCFKNRSVMPWIFQTLWTSFMKWHLLNTTWEWRFNFQAVRLKRERLTWVPLLWSLALVSARVSLPCTLSSQTGPLNSSHGWPSGFGADKFACLFLQINATSGSGDFLLSNNMFPNTAYYDEKSSLTAVSQVTVYVSVEFVLLFCQNCLLQKPRHRQLQQETGCTG